MCLHFEISSVLLLRMLFPLNNAISSFSFRQRLHLSDERLKREHFLRILHFISGTEFLRFIFQYSFESSVSFLCNGKLKDLLWLLYIFLNVVSAIPIKMFSPWVLSLHVMLASYTIFSAWQFPFSRQSSFLMQLHFCSFRHGRFWRKAFIMAVDDWFYVFCTAVDNFYCVSVKDFVQFVMSREMFISYF